MTGIARAIGTIEAERPRLELRDAGAAFRAGQRLAAQFHAVATAARTGQWQSDIGVCARGLGIRRMNQTVTVIDTPENRGMINKINYMLQVEEA